MSEELRIPAWVSLRIAIFILVYQEFREVRICLYCSTTTLAFFFCILFELSVCFFYYINTMTQNINKRSHVTPVWIVITNLDMMLNTGFGNILQTDVLLFLFAIDPAKECIPRDLSKISKGIWSTSTSRCFDVIVLNCFEAVLHSVHDHLFTISIANEVRLMIESFGNLKEALSDIV